MNHFSRRDGQLYAEDVALADLAERYGTPLYVYSRAALEAGYRAYADVGGDPPHQIRYSVKANGNLAVLNRLARMGSGFDIVSGGELERVRRAGGDMRTVVFSGVGKSDAELRAALAAGIECFNVESLMELDALSARATEMGVEAPVALRINPDIDAGVHPHVATGRGGDKFGVDVGDALAACRSARSLPNVALQGLSYHIGSQLQDRAPALAALDVLLELSDALAGEGIALAHINVGGGLGVRYRDEEPPEPADWVDDIKRRAAGRALTLLFEPGRSIAAPAGMLVTRVRYLKSGGGRRFAVVDAAMNDWPRSALYQAWHEISEVGAGAGAEPQRYDVVGPVCESADCLGADRLLRIEPGSLLAIADCGAYGFCMASQYNGRTRAAEALVDGDRSDCVRRRESLDDLWRGEYVPPP